MKININGIEIECAVAHTSSKEHLNEYQAIQSLYDERIKQREDNPEPKLVDNFYSHIIR